MDEKILNDATAFWLDSLWHIVFSAIVVLLAFLGYFIVRKIINSFLKKVSAESSPNANKKKTVLKLLLNIFKYAFVVLSLLIILQIFGVNVTSIIAGLGIATAVVGLAFQDALKDVIMGFNIIVDDYYSVGDIITVGDIHGTVVELGLKATRIRDFDDGDIHVIGNRNIVSSKKEMDLIIAEVPMPYEESAEKIEELLGDIMDIARKTQPELKEISYAGISSFGDSAVYYRLLIQAEPNVKYQVRRNIYRIIKDEADKRSISIPYLQVDVHNR